MLEQSHKITDSCLYLLHDTVEGMLLNTKHILENTQKDNIEEISKLLLIIAFYNQELQNFEKNITEQLMNTFQFSVEELYFMYGQYDKFVGIEFHKFSDSAKKYGRNINGIFIYGKNERKDLESK